MHKSSVFKGTLLVAGTTIGGGMLALPVMTAPAGFTPSIFLFFLCWAFMATTGLLFLELCFWVDRDANIVSMARTTLGKGGEIAAWLLYLFLFYSLTLAYIAGCGDLIIDLFSESLPPWAGPLLFILIAAPLVYSGPDIVGKINVPCIAALAFFFCLFLYFGSSKIDFSMLERADWHYSFLALPVAFTTFAYQGLIPTLARYLDYDPKKGRTAILIGSFIPLLIYIIWEALILGIIPLEGKNGLQSALIQGKHSIYPLKFHIDTPYIFILGQFFAFFALITSFFGVALGLRDFLADGLKIQKTPFGKLLLSLIIFLPPLLVSMTYPAIFLRALDFAGGFGVALLLGLLPVLMVWRGRYHLGLRGAYKVAGGRLLLAFLLLFILLEVGCELFQTAALYLPQ